MSAAEKATTSPAPTELQHASETQHKYPVQTTEEQSASTSCTGGFRATIEELDCPLCLKLFFEPVTTDCKHSFCKICLQTYLTFGPRRVFQKTCPLCRRPLSVEPDALVIDTELDAAARAKYSSEYSEREQEVREEEERRRRRREQLKKLYIGNAHAMIESVHHTSNVHRWTFFVRMDQDVDESQYVSHVEILLHPTFRPNRIVVREPPFAITRIGWGIFTIIAKIHFKPEWLKDPMEVAWMLTFRGQGDYEEYEVDFVRAEVDINSHSHGHSGFTPSASTFTLMSEDDEYYDDFEDGDWVPPAMEYDDEYDEDFVTDEEEEDSDSAEVGAEPMDAE